MYAILIDAPEAEAAQAADFWSAALGVVARPFPPAPEFTTLHEAPVDELAAVRFDHALGGGVRLVEVKRARVIPSDRAIGKAAASIAVACPWRRALGRTS
jgi:hypothetical protein